MNGWTDIFVEIWMGGMGRELDGWMDKYIARGIDGLVDGWTDKWTER